MLREQSLKEKHKLLSVFFITKCINMIINKGSTGINVFPEITISGPICTINIKCIVIPTVSGALLELMEWRTRKLLTINVTFIKEPSKRYFTLPWDIIIYKNSIKELIRKNLELYTSYHWLANRIIGKSKLIWIIFLKFIYNFETKNKHLLMNIC